MSWTDKASIEHIKKIRDIFSVNTFVETGTFKGMNVLVHLDNFDYVFSCEQNKNYFNISNNKLIDSFLTKTQKGSPFLYNEDSKSFLKWFKKLYKEDYNNVYGKYIIFYLDAHFYDKNRPKGKGKFVVLDELKALKGFDKAIIIIHDFNEILGGIEYDGIKLNFKLLEPYLKKVNPNFYYYTNTLKSCDILKINEVNDKDMKENLKYTWSKPDKTFRGILYCLPRRLSEKQLNDMGLIKWGKIV